MEGRPPPVRAGEVGQRPSRAAWLRGRRASPACGPEYPSDRDPLTGNETPRTADSMLPHLTTRAPWFAFVVHPRSIDDLFRQGLGVFLRRFSTNDVELVTKVSSLPAIVLGEISFGFAPIRGELICVMRMPEMMQGRSAAKAVQEACTLAAQRGARVIGLGALTAPVTGGGRLLLRGLARGTTLTNGNAFTAIVIRRNVVEAAAALGLGTDARVAVIGCTGSVGELASRLLAEAGFGLTLIGRSEAKAR